MAIGTTTALLIGSGIGAGGQFFASRQASGAAKEASRVQQEATLAALAQQERMYQQTRADLQPLLAAEVEGARMGLDARRTLHGLMGLPMGAPAEPTQLSMLAQPAAARLAPPGGFGGMTGPEAGVLPWYERARETARGSTFPTRAPVMESTELELPDGRTVWASPWDVGELLSRGARLVRPQGREGAGTLAGLAGY